MKYCILGGGGSFGLHTAAHLLESGVDTERVVSIGRSLQRPECFSLGVGKDDPRYSYRPYHLTYEFDLLMEHLDAEKPGTFINFAAQGESATSFRHSWRYYETNCAGLSRLVEALQTRPYFERFVHVGTSELYGATQFPANEAAALRPTSPYAVSKAAFDLHLLTLADRGFPMNIIRPSNAYGEGQQLHRLIPKTILCGLVGEKLPLQGGGVAKKSYIHNYDLARAVYLVARHGTVGKVYNAGPAEPTAICDIVRKIAKLMYMKYEDLVEIAPDREHQDASYWLDSKAIAEDVHWYPMVDWNDGLNRVIAWVRKYFDELKRYPTEFRMRA